MKKHIVFCLIVAFMAAGASIQAEPPELEAPVNIEADGEPIPGVDNGYTCPNIGDWDGDGDFDLLVGLFVDAPVFYFENTGGNEQPAFTSHGAMEADGEVIVGPYG